jgi:hypothetical protein
LITWNTFKWCPFQRSGTKSGIFDVRSDGISSVSVARASSSSAEGTIVSDWDSKHAARFKVSKKERFRIFMPLQQRHLF